MRSEQLLHLVGGLSGELQTPGSCPPPPPIHLVNNNWRRVGGWGGASGQSFAGSSAQQEVKEGWRRTEFLLCWGEIPLFVPDLCRGSERGSGKQVTVGGPK